jgi:hypothetical protein
VVAYDSLHRSRTSRYLWGASSDSYDPAFNVRAGLTAPKRMQIAKYAWLRVLSRYSCTLTRRKEAEV